jgi:hypothetical protein
LSIFGDLIPPSQRRRRQRSLAEGADVANQTLQAIWSGSGRSDESHAIRDVMARRRFVVRNHVPTVWGTFERRGWRVSPSDVSPAKIEGDKRRGFIVPIGADDKEGNNLPQARRSDREARRVIANVRRQGPNLRDPHGDQPLPKDDEVNAA